jgi:hypothetical protein
MSTVRADDILNERDRRLPQWAQNELARLRQTVINLQDTIKTIRTSTEGDYGDSDTCVRGIFGQMPEVALGKRPVIGFDVIGPDRNPYIDVSILRDLSAVEVRGSSVLTFRALASNVIQVSLDNS